MKIFTDAQTVRTQIDGFRGLPGRDGRDGADGAPGKNGYTPQKGVDYFDGAPGKDGQDGAQGEKGVDGVSPVVTLAREEDGVRIGVRDAEGEKSAKVYDGADGTHTSAVLIADETIETEDGSAIAAYVKELEKRYRRVAAMMYMPDAVGGAKYINIWNEDVEPIKSAHAAKSVCYISGTHKIVAFDIETTGVILDGRAGTGASTDNGYATSYMLVNKLTRNDHIDAVYAMKYITGFSICFAVPSGTRVVVYGWPYEGSDEA
ncbi:MAG: collagen-like protein [Clostridia bacterium]|nr:collagen-like protein [Clostridia bacterium]